jgi:hypothetical protein
VRGTDTGALTRVADALAVRIEAALPAAVGGLDDDAAAELRRRIDAMHEALALRAGLPDGAAVRDRWLDGLGGLVGLGGLGGLSGRTGPVGRGRSDLHGLIAGRLVRLLLDADRLDAGQAAVLLQAALSLGVPPPAKGAWVEGFLGGGGMLLAHDSTLLALVDGWVSGLAEQEFTDVLPLLRRTFSTFEQGERRSIGDRVRRGAAPATSAVGVDGGGDGWDVDADRALPAVLAAVAILAQDR